MTGRQIVFLVILDLTLLAIFLVVSAEKYTDEVWTVRLRDCYLDYHASIHALACPGVDYIRLWPVVQSWEDPTDGPGWYAETPPDAAGF